MAMPTTQLLQRNDLPLGYQAHSTPKAYIPFAQPSLSPQHQTQAIHIALGTLQNFEIVTDQFQQDGILFENAIAISPSNPAFPTRSENILLVGGPKSGVIDLLFLEPVYEVEGYVTSSTTTVLTSFDAHGQIIRRSETLGSNLSGRDHTHHPANTRLAIGDTPPSPMTSIEPSPSWPNPLIHRVQFRSPGGQFTITDIRVLR